jgi:hypothetical protein
MSVSLVAIAAVAMYGWMVAPHVRYLYAVQRYEPAVQNAGKQRSLLRQALGTKRRKLEASQTELATLRSLVFTPEEARDFFDGMESLCRQTGCTVISANFDSPSGGSRPSASRDRDVTATRRIHLIAAGRYDQIVAMLNQLQARPQRVHIDACRVELDLTSGELKCDMTMTLWVLCVGANPNGE